MSKNEVNKFLMRAVTDADFRDKFLADPIDAAKGAGASADTLTELKKVDMARVRKQFGHLSQVSADLFGSIVADGHSSDHLDRSNIHDNDGHIHDKAGSMLGSEVVSLPGERARLDAAALKDALADPAILKEIENNPSLKASLKKVVKGPG